MNLRYTKLDSACTHSLTLMHQRLRDLDLAATGMDAAGMTQLFSVPWPQLETLVLSGNKLASTTVEELVLVSMPNLTLLCINSSSLRTDAVQHLARGNWPYLQHLKLCNNHLNNAAMAHLAKGRWPRLQKLWLSGSCASDYGVVLLMQGAWPQLNFLVLDSRVVSKRSWTLLSLASFTHDKAKKYLACRARRAVPVGPEEVHCEIAKFVWPKLTEVFFEPINYDFMIGSSKVDSKKPAGRPWLKLVSFGMFLAMFVTGHRSSGN